MATIYLDEPQPLEIQHTPLPDNVGDLPVEEQVKVALESIYDPEIPVNIWELGLIYDHRVMDDIAFISMTLTAPACPVAGAMPEEVKKKVETLPTIKEAKVTMVWEPAWTQDMMSEDAQLALNLPY